MVKETIKNQKFNLEQAKFNRSMKREEYIFLLLSLLLKLSAACYAVYIIVSLLEALANKNPTALHELAGIVSALKLQYIVGAMVGTSGVAYGLIQRTGKRRAIKKLSYLQELNEKDDPYRGSSQLTREGSDSKPVRG